LGKRRGRLSKDFGHGSQPPNLRYGNFSLCKIKEKERQRDREREREKFILYRKSIHKIQTNSTKHKINKYIDFLMRGSEEKDHDCARLNENRAGAVVEVCNLSSEYFYHNCLTNSRPSKNVKKRKRKKEKKKKKRKIHRNQSNIDFVPKLSILLSKFMLIVQKPLRYFMTLFKNDFLLMTFGRYDFLFNKCDQNAHLVTFHFAIGFYLHTVLILIQQLCLSPNLVYCPIKRPEKSRKLKLLL